MEQPKKHTAYSRREPGRRYAAHRPLARAGTDVYSERPRQEAPKPIVARNSAPENEAPKPRQTGATKPAMQRTKRSMVLRRQMVERAKEQRVQKKKKRNLHALWYIFGLIVISALAIVIWSFREALPVDIDFFKSDKPQVVNIVDPEAKELSTLEEVASSESEIAANIVAADAPKTLRIPSLNVTARIRQVGTTLSGEPIAPKNIYDVGWYEGSSKPGADGAVLLNGHLAGPTKPGVFTDIQALKVGDVISVERGDGRVITYAISRIQEYTGGQIDMSAAISSIEPGKAGLNLVTTLNKFSGTEKRTIIFAVQQDKN